MIFFLFSCSPPSASFLEIPSSSFDGDCHLESRNPKSASRPSLHLAASNEGGACLQHVGGGGKSVQGFEEDGDITANWLRIWGMGRGCMQGTHGRQMHERASPGMRWD